jgi:hypothetical protein
MFLFVDKSQRGENRLLHDHTQTVTDLNKELQEKFSPGIPVSSTNKTDCYDTTEILFKVALNTINLSLKQKLSIHTTYTNH